MFSPVYKLTTTDGRVLYRRADLTFWVDDQWVHAAELRQGDTICDPKDSWLTVSRIEAVVPVIVVFDTAGEPVGVFPTEERLRAAIRPEGPGPHDIEFQPGPRSKVVVNGRHRFNLFRAEYYL